MSEKMTPNEREQWGYAVVTTHFEQHGYHVERSVDPWVDLIATKGEERLLLEVKARAGPGWPFLDISAKDFNALADENYRLCLIYPVDDEPVIRFVTIQDITRIKPRFRIYLKKQSE